MPAGFDRSLAGGGAALVVTFSGAVPSAPGTTITPLTEDGENSSGSFGAAQGSDARRYRLTLSGLSLDFGATPFIGLAIWARGQELIAPQRRERLVRQAARGLDAAIRARPSCRSST